MAIADRKQREKEDLKKKILEAAKSLFVEKGFDATSMRSIAERVEFSPTTLYLYYKDKNEIVFALHQEGFKLLSQQFKVIAHVEHPFERLKAMGRIYLQFAEDNNDYYELMFVREGPLIHVQKHNQDDWEEGSRTYNVLYETILNVSRQGILSMKNHIVFRLSFGRRFMVCVCCICIKDWIALNLKMRMMAIQTNPGPSIYMKPLLDLLKN